ncbi:hypothetical protein G176_gp24 [Xanthomonas phage CP1]|uniref:Peptidase S74 domain-containing protein n=1 Tax=Xanthomonas phage CP1 TaxID=2994055 RepID=I7H419_9CAUD|nr:hypothetical protein G176_gp24 [Xanthomonas phage CP1]BAM29096.1 hypothetical protein [Xanthomonas phage CP1]
MAFQQIDLDTTQPNGKLGDPARTAFTKVNNNFADAQSQINALGTSVSGSATSQQLAAEATARQNADSTLQTNITSVSAVANAALPKTGGTVGGNLSVSGVLSTTGDVTAGGPVSSATGYKTKAGSATSASPGADLFNFSWANSQLSAWVNTTNLGRVALGSDITTINNTLTTKFDKSGGTINGGVVINGPVTTSGSIQAGAGYVTRNGTSGLPGSNLFNFNWSNGKLNAFVDTTDLGSIAYQNSDYRIKEDVRYIQGGDLDKVMLGRPCEWRYKPDVIWYDGGELHRSFIAHEMQEIDPVLAVGVKDEVYGPDNKIRAQGVDLLSITSMLWGALQEEHKLLLALQERVATLDTRLKEE